MLRPFSIYQEKNPRNFKSIAKATCNSARLPSRLDSSPYEFPLNSQTPEPQPPFSIPQSPPSRLSLPSSPSIQSSIKLPFLQAPSMALPFGHPRHSSRLLLRRQRMLLRIRRTRLFMRLPSCFLTLAGAVQCCVAFGAGLQCLLGCGLILV
jgi:hypothetical protein